MNICIATPEFCTEGNAGGYGRYVENLSCILANKGHNVFVVVLSDKTEDFSWKDNITVCRVTYRDGSEKCKTKTARILFFPLIYIWRIYGRSFVIRQKVRNLNKSVGIDIFQTSSIMGINILTDRTIPTVMRVSGNPMLNFHALSYDYDYNTARDCRVPCLYNLSLQALEKADYVFSSSKFAAREISRRYHVNIEVIESPYEINAETDDTVYKEKLAGKRYFLFFSGMNFLKGLRAIAECLEQFLGQNKEVFFVFCGSDSSLDINSRKIRARDYIIECSGIYKDRVIFIDRLSDKSKLFGLINHAEACVMPSRVDNLPNTCIEAMSLGKIVIGTNGSSLEQMIQDGETGFLCEIDDARDLLVKMNNVAQMAGDERQYIGSRAKDVIDRMNPENIYDKMMEVFHFIRLEVNN